MEIVYYYIICIFVRLSLAYSVYYVQKMPIRYLFVFLYFILSLGELYQYTMKTRTVGAFHNKVWWDSLRPIHALLFLFTSVSLFYKYKYSYMFLLLDTLISVLGYIFMKPNHKYFKH